MADNPLATRARTLAEKEKTGALCTMSAKFHEYPFGSLVQYALDASGNPIFFISAMAQHTRNVLANPRASLLVAESVPPEQAVVAGRVTLLGDIEPLRETSDVAPLFLARHPDAAQWAGFGDFGFYRLWVKAIYFVGGFGQMGWVSPEDYSSVLPPLTDNF
jgi:putative heme iron utilization protein